MISFNIMFKFLYLAGPVFEGILVAEMDEYRESERVQKYDRLPPGPSTRREIEI